MSRLRLLYTTARDHLSSSIGPWSLSKPPAREILLGDCYEVIHPLPYALLFFPMRED